MPLSYPGGMLSEHGCHQQDWSNLKDGSERSVSEQFWHQISSLGSTASGTPLSPDAPRWEWGTHPLSKEGTDFFEEEEDYEEEDSSEEVQDQGLRGDAPAQGYYGLAPKVRQPSGPVRARPWRQRKYRDPCLADTDAVVICGPLQQRCWGFAWRWRWCILENGLLHIYRSEACWRKAPSDPFETLEVSEMVAVDEWSPSSPHAFRVIRRDDGSTLETFRGGDSDLWEETAANSLWVHMINFAERL